ncbi:MAG: vitamin B12 transporter [Flavobacterium sp.]|jgi:vitamin B12 transporter
MTVKHGITFLFLFFSCLSFGQQDSIVSLEEVILPDYNLKNNSNSLLTNYLNDSLIKNSSSLTSLLRNNTSIYFKENGLGMVSSASFRGTTAQQTAVIWNGININSQFNGQTDFNTISASDFNEVVVRHGGGSSIYGSSAIGGSIHLNTELNFKSKLENLLQLEYGSFETSKVNYQLRFARKKFSSQVSFTHNSSQNDYPYLNTNQKNENGDFYNSSYNMALGFKLNPKNSIFYYSYLFSSNRHFSGTLVSPSFSKYKDFNTRNLIEWNSEFSKFTSKLQLAFLSEMYTYFENKEFNIFDDARAETLVAKYQLNYNLSKKLQFSTLLDITHAKGFGESIGENSRTIYSAIFLSKFLPTEKLVIEASVRQELTSNYESPFLFSLGTVYQITKWYDLKTNISRNYRIPTFNDLFYKGSGNTTLKPEIATQFEVGNSFKLVNNFKLDVVGYYIKIKELLRWSPNSSGSWTPNNVANVTSYGAEISLNYNFKYHKNIFDLQTNYAYTVSQDDAKNKQLIYVPFHKQTTTFNYRYLNFSMYLNYVFNGSVFTTSDNNYILSNYSVANFGLRYVLPFYEKLTIGSAINNIFNENYQSVSQRPMPGRNYNFLITLNF